MSDGEIVGLVRELWRYPVKSMMGEQLKAAMVVERGLAGDRAWALIDDETGKVVSAKRPQRWGRLFEFSARFMSEPDNVQPAAPVEITFPDGRTMPGGSGASDALSALLGRPVSLAPEAPTSPVLEEYWPDVEGLTHQDRVTQEPMPSGTFFDLAPVHLLTTATLAKLSELYPEGKFEPRRFRPNILVEGRDPGLGFVENDWVDRTLTIGREVELVITGLCPRCVMTTLPQGDLPPDRGILQTAARHNGANVGVYAGVIRGGLIRERDPVTLG